MSAYLYRQAFSQTIESSFEPGRPNKFQTWLTEVFLKDTNKFYLSINGERTEINRARIAAKALELGKQYMENNQTHKLPEGFFRLEVLPSVIADLGG
jgi:hypothetical protein